MSYLQEFRNTLENKHFPDLLQLWDEYRSCELFDAHEFLEILTQIYHSGYVETFGPYAESGLMIWEKLQEQNETLLNQILMLLVDLQTTSTPQLAQICIDYLQKHFSEVPDFDEKLRFVGLKNADRFQGALRNFQLLSHLVPGRYVYHSAGWGVGEINDVSFVREQISLEFENIYGVKEITFSNAFQTLIPLQDDHFLARRFGDPDKFEAFAKKNPQETIRILLRDFGSKTAAEIKEELCEWVISKEDWSSWWQSTRNKLKKDGHIECPAKLKAPFRLRREEISQEDELHRTLTSCATIDQRINALYTFMRDSSERLKVPAAKELVVSQLQTLLAQTPTQPQFFEITTLLSDLDVRSVDLTPVREAADLESFLRDVQILALKKRLLMAVRETRENWPEIFAGLLPRLEQSGLRDYAFRELSHSDAVNGRHLLNHVFDRLVESPEHAPETFLWYFQKLLQMGDAPIPYGDKGGRCLWLQALLVLLSRLELTTTHRETVKRIHALLIGHQFAIVRSIIEGTSLDYLKEFFHLVSKCYSLSEHDVRIMKSLAAVVQPKVAAMKGNGAEIAREEAQIIWATPQGLEKIQRKIEQIGTVDIVENAREIEAARAMGDLRENSEYKFALEKRSRLQSDLNTLSKSINQSRLLTPRDISTEVAGVGCFVELQSQKGRVVTYTILGPWEADSEQNVISHQSKLAQLMEGKKVGELFQFQGEGYTVKAIRSALS